MPLYPPLLIVSDIQGHRTPKVHIVQWHKSILTSIISLALWTPYIFQTPFAWVSVKEEENKKTTVTLEKLGARDASKYLTMRKRGTDRMGRQNTFSSPNKPLLKYAHIQFSQTFQIKYPCRKNSTLCFFKILFSGLTLNLRNLSWLPKRSTLFLNLVSVCFAQL